MASSHRQNDIIWWRFVCLYIQSEDISEVMWTVWTNQRQVFISLWPIGKHCSTWPNFSPSFALLRQSWLHTHHTQITRVGYFTLKILLIYIRFKWAWNYSNIPYFSFIFTHFKDIFFITCDPVARHVFSRRKTFAKYCVQILAQCTV